MSFSAEWLRLREPVDHRSRDKALLARAAGYLSGKDEPVIYDLGAAPARTCAEPRSHSVSANAGCWSTTTPYFFLPRSNS